MAKDINKIEPIKKDKPTCIVTKHDVLEIDEMDGVTE